MAVILAIYNHEQIFFLSLHNEMVEEFSLRSLPFEILWLLSKYESHHDGGGRGWQMILHLESDNILQLCE